MSGNSFAFLCLILVLLATAFGVSLYIYYGRTIMRSRVVGAPVELQRMVRMTFSGLNAYNVVAGYLDLRQAGVTNVSLDSLEAYARRDRDVLATTRMLVESKKRNDLAAMDGIVRKIQGE